MDKLSLSVLLHGHIAALVNELRDASLPAFVTCAFAKLEGPVPNELDTVVITDDLTFVQGLLTPEHDRVTIVFVGQEHELVRELGCMPAAVVEVWPAQGTPQTYRLHMERLAARLKDAFDAWLYKTWLMSLIDSLPDIVWFKERSGLHNLVNLQFCETVHKTREDTKDKGHCYIWNAPPESEYQCAETDNAVMTGGKLVVADEPVETDKGMRQFRTYKSPVHGRLGEIIGTVGLGHDVTDFTNMGMELQILINNLPYPVAIANTEWRITSANRRFLEAFGITDEQVRGLDYRTWKDSLPTEVIERVAADGTKTSTVDLIVEENGVRHSYEVSEPAIIDYFDNVNGHYCLFRDVTMERAYERQTLKFANTDALTGLANRRSFHNYLLKHVGNPMTVLYLDLDNFKHVNDNYGHAKGDETLERIAFLLTREVPDGLVARQGGDEFACALPGRRDADEVARKADALRTLIHDEFAYLNVGLGCSVGVEQTDSLPADPEEFLREADKSMYADKELHHAVR